MINHFISRRESLRCLTSVFVAAPGLAMAQAPWPAQPIKFIIPFAAGGGTDVFWRLMARHAEQQLKQPVLIDSRPGAGGVIAMQALVSAPPDGYTIGLGSWSTLVVVPLTMPGTLIDPTKDLSFVTQGVGAAYVLAVSESLPVKTADELRSYLRANKGKVNFGGVNIGHFNHVVPKTMSDLTGADMVYVPYKGEAPIVTDLVGGQIQLALLTSGGARPMVDAKRLKVLGVTGTQRLRAYPDVPTLAEQGWTEPVFSMTGGWGGVVAPRGTPPAIVERLASAFNQTLRAPEVEREMDKLGYQPIGGDGKSFEANFKKDRQVWRDTLVKAGLEVN